ncbi:trypco2 family protein [Streptomyces phytophilus]|uniref:trypco2 family protein n=1 Tax=Streptomyces phytophilus TaxID=722715 RepID=UPI00215D6A8D|nr:trypco2 family protein [Streptomyces phytophilus]
MIRELRQQLTDAATEGAGQGVQFEFGSVEIEPAVTVDREAGGKSRVRFLVLDADAEGAGPSGSPSRCIPSPLVWTVSCTLPSLRMMTSSANAEPGV